jgi:glycosyltransferase involved in cell wall biosynthesis
VSISSGQNSKLNQPLVSIIIPTYNYGHYLAEAIESALNQTYKNIETIVVDDGSTDNTESVAKNYPIKYVFQKHQGISAAKNHGIKMSRGEFFVFLDADDKLAPEFVTKTLKLMEKPDVGFVRTGSIVYNEDLKIENVWMPRKPFSKYSLFAGWWGALGPVLIRRAAFESLDYGFDTKFKAFEDLDLCFRLLAKGWKTEAVYEPLHWYRVHKNSTVNPKIKEIGRYNIQIINQKYWFREPYRKFYSFYLSSFGAAAMLITHPICYLKGIQTKTRAKIWIKSQKRNNIDESERVKEVFKEIQMTTDMLTQWSYNKYLKNYYKNQLRKLESLLKYVILNNRQ